MSAATRPQRTYAEPWYNLQLYLCEAMPAPLSIHSSAPRGPYFTKGNREEYLLSSEPDSRYKLRNVTKYKVDIMHKRLLEFCAKSIPEKSILNAESTGIFVRDAYIGLKAPSFPHIILPTHRPVHSIDELFRWTETPLLAAERIMTLVWPTETKGYACMKVEHAHRNGTMNEWDAQLCRTTYWQKQIDGGHCHHSTSESRCNIVIMISVPWAIGASDMEEFVHTSRFPAYQMPLKGRSNQTYTRIQKVWAKLWESCAQRKCPFFILTNYEKWVFGTFTDGFSKAVISSVLDYDSKEPSILQWLVFWMASSLQIEGSYSRRPRPQLNPNIRHCSKVTQEYDIHHLADSAEDWLTYFDDWQPITAKTLRMEDFPGAAWVTDFDT